MSARNHLNAGHGLSRQENGAGFALNQQSRSSKWQHPWTTTAAWDRETRRWLATVRAGYVNGSCPIFRTSEVEQKVSANRFGRNPLSGEEFFSAHVFHPEQMETETETDETLELPLYLSPQIPLREWRAIGADGGVDLDLPRFFVRQGVDPFGATTERPAAQQRRLRAINLILHQPREALTAYTTEGPGILDGRGFTTTVLTTRTPVAGDLLRVYAGLYRTPADIDPLAGQYEEEAWDELKIATVFLLSPAGVPKGAQPDGTWTPYVQHALFWNLGWVPAKPLLQVADDPSIPYIPTLGGGLALPIVNTLVSAQNDLVRDAFNLIVASSRAGTWWTPTGGGHDQTVPTAQPRLAPSAGGLSKSARIALQAKLARAATAEQALEQLDPPYPYRAIGFNPARL